MVARRRRRRQRGKKRTTTYLVPLDRDLAVCSNGSENPTPRPYYGPPIDTSNADRCDFMDPTVCLQPWPNDYFTVADATTDTGRRLNLNANSMPANQFGVHIDPTDYQPRRRLQPGQPDHGQDPAGRDAGGVRQLGLRPRQQPAPLRRRQPAGGRDRRGHGRAAADLRRAGRQPEPLHARQHAGRQPDHPAHPRTSSEGHRYIVALRNLRDAQNNPVDPPMPFRVYRDRLITQDPAIENRRPHMESLISTLQAERDPRGRTST